jgi:hypothetical protein
MEVGQGQNWGCSAKEKNDEEEACKVGLPFCFLVLGATVQRKRPENGVHFVYNLSTALYPNCCIRSGISTQSR